MDNQLNFVRGLIRPILTLTIIGVLVGLTLHFAAPLVDKEIAKTLLYFFTGAGTMILGYWFGERKKS